MKKRKYDRPFVEVLMLETTRGMMDNVSVDKGNSGNPDEFHSMKRPGPSSPNWEDDLDESVDDCDSSEFSYCK